MNIWARCGNRIPGWAHGVCYVCGRIDKEEKRFGRRAIKRLYRPQLNRLSSQATMRTRSKGRTSSKLSHAALPKARVRRQVKSMMVTGHLPPQPGKRSLLYKRVVRFSRFLSDVYGAECRMSDVLRRGGLAQEDIERLKHKCLREYLDLLVRRLDEWVRGELRIPKQQQARLIRQLRLTQNRVRLETIIVETARETLRTGSSQSSMDQCRGESS